MFSQSVVVSVGMSKLGVTDLIFIDPGAKVNSVYRGVLLSQQLLPMMLTCQPSSSSFNRTALLHSGHVTLCDFSISHQQRVKRCVFRRRVNCEVVVRLLELATPALFHWICGCQTVLTLIQLTTYVECRPAGRVSAVMGVKRWQTRAVFGARLARHRPDHHWQCNWRVAWPCSCLSAGKGWTLWTNVVTILRGLSFSRVTINVSFVSISYDLQSLFL